MKETYGLAVEIPEESEYKKVRSNIQTMASYIVAKDTGKVLKNRYDFNTEWIDKEAGIRNPLYRANPQKMFLWLTFGALNNDIRYRLTPRDLPSFLMRCDDWDRQVLDKMNKDWKGNEICY